MPYELSSEELVDYIHERVYDPKFTGQRAVGIALSKDNKSLVLTAPKANKVIFTPSFIEGGAIIDGRAYDSIEIKIEPEKVGVDNQDVSGFLERLVNDDKIFDTGMPLFSHERQKKLSKWREILKRENNPPESKMVCIITNKDINTKNLRRTIYDYMVRPCLYYLFNLGAFINNTEA